jgi:hypothetical protein
MKEYKYNGICYILAQAKRKFIIFWPPLIEILHFSISNSSKDLRHGILIVMTKIINLVGVLYKGSHYRTRDKDKGLQAKMFGVIG